MLFVFGLNEGTCNNPHVGLFALHLPPFSLFLSPARIVSVIFLRPPVSSFSAFIGAWN